MAKRFIELRDHLHLKIDEVAEYEGRKARLGYFSGSPITIIHKGNAGFAPMSMVIESSPGKHHIYWRCHAFSIGRFKSFQQELVARCNEVERIR